MTSGECGQENSDCNVGGNSKTETEPGEREYLFSEDSKDYYSNCDVLGNCTTTTVFYLSGNQAYDLEPIFQDQNESNPIDYLLDEVYGLIDDFVGIWSGLGQESEHRMYDDLYNMVHEYNATGRESGEFQPLTITVYEDIFWAQPASGMDYPEHADAIMISSPNTNKSSVMFINSGYTDDVLSILSTFVHTYGAYR
jgi:hypothetical protein